MPDLAIQVQEIKGVPGTALVILNGSIDAKTVITFQTHLNSVKERGIDRFILDMESVKYVNSTGLGYLINLSDSVGGDKGGISLVKVQPKVKVVFDMLGLNAFFKIYASRDEAVKALSTAPKAGQLNATAIMKSDETRQNVPGSPPRPAQAPATTVTPRAPTPKPGIARPAAARPGMAPPRPAAAAPARPQAPAPRPAVPSVSVPSGPADPINVDCSTCRTPLRLTEYGTFKCPRCMTLLSYQGKGRVSFLPRQKSLPVQLTLNFDPACVEGLLEFVGRMAAKSGFNGSALDEVRTAAKETVETIRKHAYKGNDKNVYHVLMVAHAQEIELRFADYGTSLSDNGDLFGGVRSRVDRVDLKNHPRGGNVVIISKKAN